MPGMTLTQMQQLQDKMWGAKDDTVINFLQVFEEDNSLDKDELLEWMQMRVISADIVNKCFKEAQENGWVEVKDNVIYRTAAGKLKSEER